MNEVTVDYIDGFLSCGCDGLDYVTFYGATRFENTEEGIKASLKQHLGMSQLHAWRAPNCPRIDNFEIIDNSGWKQKLDQLLEKWIHQKSNFDSDFIES